MSMVQTINGYQVERFIDCGWADDGRSWLASFVCGGCRDTIDVMLGGEHDSADSQLSRRAKHFCPTYWSDRKMQCRILAGAEPSCPAC